MRKNGIYRRVSLHRSLQGGKAMAHDTEMAVTPPRTASGCVGTESGDETGFGA